MRRDLAHPVELCGDLPLSRRERWRYLSHGLRQLASSLRSGVSAEPFTCDARQPEVRSKIAEGASPLRVYTCALAGHVASSLPGAEGPICDVGCGPGEHSRFFAGLDGQHFYVGIDRTHNPQWVSGGEPGPLAKRFVQTSVTQLGVASGSLAFVFSSSMLEHVDDVHRAVRELAAAMRPGSHGLHIVPSVWALFLYLFHGYRRFSTRDLARLFLGADLDLVRLWSLGGVASFLLHAVWITGLERWVGSQMRRGGLLRIYASLLRAALVCDRWMPWLPVGYAVIVRKPQRCR
jgi:SAM-dependent methyltransferase